MSILNSRRVIVLAAGAILFCQLILPPVAGLADNGDFGKVILRFDLNGRVHRACEYIDTVYLIRPATHWVSAFFSTEIPLARLAVWINRVVSRDGNFDLRSIGVVHGALFLLALWLFVPVLAGAGRGVRWAVCALVLFVYCDAMYVNGLNSFYMDEPAFLFLLLTAVACLRVLQRGKRSDAILLMLCPFLLVGAKAQHAPLGLWIALLFVVAGKRLRPFSSGNWRAAAACLVLASALMMWLAQPPAYAGFPLYNAVFGEILPHSRNVGRTLQDLGLDDSYRASIRKSAYQPDSGMLDPAFQRRFLQRVSPGNLAVFYARHPAVAYQAMVDGLAEAGRQTAFGNFDIATGYPPYTESRAFALWRNAKRAVFFRHGAAFLFTFLGLSALLVGFLWQGRKRLPRGALPAGLCLIGAAATEMGLATLTDATEMTRHSTIFFALFDMIALVCAWFAIAFVARRVSREAAGAAASADDVEIVEAAPDVAETPPAPDLRWVDRCLFAVGALLLAAYFFRLTRASLHVYFTGDDLMNLYRSWYFPAAQLVKANLLFFLNSDFLRPMGSVWYRAIIDCAGFNPFWFHACNLAMLAANIWLTYSVARRLAGSREIAALTALAMAYQQRLGSLYFDTGFVYDVLCYFFLFAALALYLHVRARGDALRWWHWVALFALYICALNSKEIAVILPAILAAYELLYHPPGDWRFRSLRRWLLLEGWPAMLAGAVAVLFVVGRSIGPQALLHNGAYRPSFTLAQFLLTSAHFAGDFTGTPDWPAWAVVLVWTALAANAWAARSRVLAFAWLYLMLAPLPVAFILPRGAAQYYVCVFGWMLYAAVVVVRIATFFTRGIPLPEWWLTRARGAILFAVSMAILYSAFKPLGYADIASVTEVAPLNRALAEQLHAAAPAIRHGSRLLFLNDPISPDIFDLLFLVRLSYGDRTIEVARVKQMPQRPSDQEIAAYDYVFDYSDGRLVVLKMPS